MKKQLAILLFLVSIPAISSARGWSAGPFSSPKGFGFSADRQITDSRFLSMSVYLDNFDRMLANNGSPGVAANVSQNIIFFRFTPPETDACLYAGPGVSFGYVRDRGDDHPGPMLAASGTFGAKFTFKRGIAVDLSLTGAAGIHLDIGEDASGTKLSLYKRGMTHTLLPQVKIMFPLSK